MTDIRRDLHAAVDELTPYELTTLNTLAVRGPAPCARTWLSETLRAIARVADEAGSRPTFDLVITARCPDCHGPTHCDCPQGDGCGC